MAFFVAAGIISDKIVRKETRNGVLATFRLETGAPNNRRLWIDVEAWGQLAGTVAHHGSVGRGVLVSGRLTYKTWRDRETGDSCHRYVVTALDVDLRPEGSEPTLLPSTVVVAGTVETVYPKRPTKRGVVHSFRLVSGRAGSKTGRLWIDVEHWHRDGASSPALPERAATTVSGQLAYRRREIGSSEAGFCLRAATLDL
ncbi:MAG: single-stranded DNA-binding protein [Acidimicrobiales bacterium]|nr:single-stranded DNA-binding protein [Acidimicrobiales bacterium]